MNKICSNCNAVVDESVKFCPYCGLNSFQAMPEQSAQAPQDNEVTNEQPLQNDVQYNDEQQPVESVADNQPIEGYQQAYDVQQPEQQAFSEYGEPLQTNTAAADNNFQNVSFENPQPKKKKKLVMILACTLIPLALVAAILFNMNSLIGFAMKTFASDAAYYQYVEKNTLSSFSDDISKIYNAISSPIATDKSFDTKISLNYSDEALDMFGDLNGGNTDLSWLNDIALNISGNTKDDKISASIGCSISGKQILSINNVTDLKKEMAYFSFNELSNEILGVDLSSVLKSAGSSELSNIDLGDVISSVRNILPDSDVVGKLINKYLKIALDNVTEVKKSNETLEVGKLSKKYTVLEVTITEKTVANMVESILKAARDDKDIAKIIDNIKSSAKDLGFSEEASEISQSAFVDLIDEALETVEDEKDNASDDEIFVIKNYVDSSNKIIGRALIVGSGEVLSYANIKNGSDFAFSFVQSGSVSQHRSIEGSGTQKGDVITGTFDFIDDGETVCTLEFEDFNIKDVKEGKLNGTLRVESDSFLPSKSNSSSGSSNYSTVISTLIDSVEYKFESSGNKMKCDINIINDDKQFCGLSFETTVSGAKNIDDVSSKDVVDVEDESALKDYLKNLDFDKLIDNLKQTSIPSDLVDRIESALDSLQSSMNSSSSYSSNSYGNGYSSYNDYDYGYGYNDSYGSYSYN